MAGLLDTIRDEFPQYKGMDDYDLIHGVAKDLNMDPREVAKGLNYNAPKLGPLDQFGAGIGQAVSGAGAGLARVAANITQKAADDYDTSKTGAAANERFADPTSGQTPGLNTHTLGDLVRPGTDLLNKAADRMARYSNKLGEMQRPANEQPGWKGYANMGVSAAGNLTPAFLGGGPTAVGLYFGGQTANAGFERTRELGDTPGVTPEQAVAGGEIENAIGTASNLATMGAGHLPIGRLAQAGLGAATMQAGATAGRAAQNALFSDRKDLQQPLFERDDVVQDVIGAGMSALGARPRAKSSLMPDANPPTKTASPEGEAIQQGEPPQQPPPQQGSTPPQQAAPQPQAPQAPRAPEPQQAQAQPTPEQQGPAPIGQQERQQVAEKYGASSAPLGDNGKLKYQFDGKTTYTDGAHFDNVDAAVQKEREKAANSPNWEVQDKVETVAASALKDLHPDKLPPSIGSVEKTVKPFIEGADSVQEVITRLNDALKGKVSEDAKLNRKDAALMEIRDRLVEGEKRGNEASPNAESQPAQSSSQQAPAAGPDGKSAGSNPAAPKPAADAGKAPTTSTPAQASAGKRDAAKGAGSAKPTEAPVKPEAAGQGNVRVDSGSEQGRTPNGEVAPKIGGDSTKERVNPNQKVGAQDEGHKEQPSGTSAKDSGIRTGDQSPVPGEQRARGDVPAPERSEGKSEPVADRGNGAGEGKTRSRTELDGIAKDFNGGSKVDDSDLIDLRDSIRKEALKTNRANPDARHTILTLHESGYDPQDIQREMIARGMEVSPESIKSTISSYNKKGTFDPKLEAVAKKRGLDWHALEGKVREIQQANKPTEITGGPLRETGEEGEKVTRNDVNVDTGTVKGAGGSKSNWKDTGSIGERTVKVAQEIIQLQKALTKPGADRKAVKARIAELEAERNKLNEEAKAELSKKAAANSKEGGKEVSAARRLWNEQKRNIEGVNIPNFDALHEEAKDAWIQANKEGRTGLVDMNRVFDIHEEARRQDGDFNPEDNTPSARGESGLPEALNSATAYGGLTGKSAEEHYLAATKVRFSSLLSHPGLRAAFDTLKNLGLIDHLKGIGSFRVGRLAHKGGAYWHDPAQGVDHAIFFDDRALRDWNDANVKHVALHEVFHMMDGAQVSNGIYSMHPDFAWKVEGDRLVPVGEVAKEIAQLASTDKRWADMVNYAMRVGKEKGHIELQKEMFADMAGYYQNGKLGAKMLAEAPKLSAFIEGAMEHAKENKVATTTSLQATRARLDFRGKFDVADAAPARGLNGELRGGAEQQGAGPSEARASEAMARLFGEWSSERDDAYGRTNAERLIGRLPENLQRPTQRLYDNISHFTKSGAYGLAFTHDLVNYFKKVLPSVANHEATQYARAAMQNEFDKRTGKIIDSIGKLDKNSRTLLEKFVFDSTSQEKWGFKPSFKQGATVDPAFESRFKALPADVQKAVKDIFQHSDTLLKAKQKAANDRITSEYDDQINDAVEAGASQDKIDALAKERDDLLAKNGTVYNQLNGPYVSLMRHGDFAVVAHSAEMTDAIKNGNTKRVRELETLPNHKFVNFYDDMGRAKEKARELQATGHYETVDAFAKEPENFKNDPNWMQLARLRENVTQHYSQSMGTSADSQALAAAVHKSLTNAYISMLHESSIRKTELKRRGVYGFDPKDILPNFVRQARADSHAIAGMTYADESLRNLSKMRREAHEPGDADGGKELRMDGYNEFMKRQIASYAYVPGRGTTNVLLQANSFMRLLTSPAFFIQNMTQPYMLSLPLMAGRAGVGYAKGWKTLNGAYRDIAPLLRNPVGNVMDLSKFQSRVGSEHEMIKALQAKNLLDMGQAHDLGVAMLRDGTVGKTWEKTMSKMAIMTRNMEIVNRFSSAIAAYRLAHEDLTTRGHSADEAHRMATNYAEDIIQQTHGDYSEFNAPRLIRAGGGVPAARLVFQFRKYQMMQASLFTRTAYNMFKGSTPAEKAVARRSMAWMLAQHGVFAGALGLPLANVAGQILKTVFGDGVQDEEQLVRDAIGNKEVSDILLHGLPGAVGLDLSKRIGMGDAFSPLPYAKINLSDGKKGFDDLLLNLMGPVVAEGRNIADGASQIAQGNYYKGLEKVLPTGLANAIRAEQMATRGLTNSRGDTVVRPEDVSAWDTAMQLVGFPTMTVTERGRKAEIQYEYTQHFQKQNNEIKTAYSEAHKDGDTEGMRQAREDWNELQKRRKDRGFQQEPLSQLLMAPYAQRQRERNDTGGLEYNQQNKRFVKQLAGE